MRKILLVAKRDFLATVSTKGFIIAIMVPPLIWGAIILGFPRMMNNRVPAVTGSVAVIDQTGQVTDGVRRYLDPAGDGQAPRCVVQPGDRIEPVAGAPAERRLNALSWANFRTSRLQSHQ